MRTISDRHVGLGFPGDPSYQASTSTGLPGGPGTAPRPVGIEVAAVDGVGEVELWSSNDTSLIPSERNEEG